MLSIHHKDFKYTSQVFSDELLKGVYPHEYMNSFKSFFDDKLTDRCKCYSPLRGKCISEKDHLHAVNVWNML